MLPENLNVGTQLWQCSLKISFLLTVCGNLKQFQEYNQKC